MKKEELKEMLLNLYRSGQLITPKHDPENLSTTRDKYRTVLSLEMANDFELFVTSGKWDAVEYDNKDYPDNPYIIITPHADSWFSVPASGVAPRAAMPSTDCDLLVTVSGPNLGWHIYGEASANIGQKIGDGDLIVRGSLD